MEAVLQQNQFYSIGPRLRGGRYGGLGHRGRGIFRGWRRRRRRDFRYHFRTRNNCRRISVLISRSVILR